MLDNKVDFDWSTVLLYEVLRSKDEPNKKPSTQDLTQMDGINLNLPREIRTAIDLNLYKYYERTSFTTPIWLHAGIHKIVTQKLKQSYFEDAI